MAVKENSPEKMKRPALTKKFQAVRRQSFTEYQEQLESAFPYMYSVEVSRFIQLIFHEIAKTLHEKKSLIIPFFGTFSVKPVKQYRIFKRDIWNGYGEWVDIKEPITDWVPFFQPGYYVRHLTANRYAQIAKSYISGNEDVGNTAYWDKVFQKFMKREEALMECPYSLSAFGWAGYRYHRILKEATHFGETIRITSRDGEVYQLKDSDGNHDEKFKEAYAKAKQYVEEIAKRRIYKLRKRTNLKKIWNTTYSTYLNQERQIDKQEVEEERNYRISLGLTTTYFYVLKFGYGFETGETRKVYRGYLFTE